MTILRIVATILVLGPFFGFAGTVYGQVGAFNVISESEVTKAGDLAPYIYFALVATLIGLLAFLPGVFLHAVIAKRTGVYSMAVWILILTMSIFTCVMGFPIGTVLGLVSIILLFTLPTFKKMRPGSDDARGAAVG